MDSAASFGLWLRRRRMALGLTHAALAESRALLGLGVAQDRRLTSGARRTALPKGSRLVCKFPLTERASSGQDRARRAAHRSVRARLSAVALPPPLMTRDAASPAIATFDVYERLRLRCCPFANLSDDATNEHFADGLAEELLNVLAKIPGLRVASRTSAFSFKGNKGTSIFRPWRAS